MKLEFNDYGLMPVSVIVDTNDIRNTSVFDIYNDIIGFHCESVIFICDSNVTESIMDKIGWLTPKLISDAFGVTVVFDYTFKLVNYTFPMVVANRIIYEFDKTKFRVFTKVASRLYRFRDDDFLIYKSDNLSNISHVHEFLKKNEVDVNFLVSTSIPKEEFIKNKLYTIPIL